MTCEPRYTLAEARLALNKEECSRRDHDYEILLEITGPAAILCKRCGRSWAISREKP